VLTEVKAYSSWVSAPTLSLSDTGRAETDLIQIRNIDGLDPVNAAVNTTPFGAVDGGAYTGGNVTTRNIVLTLHPNPDWDLWTHESLRKLLYSYFMPKRPTRLVFQGDDFSPVEISGIVESVQINPFSKDPEFVVSIICPDPYFTSVDPIIVTGQSVHVATGASIIVDYKGNVESGMHVQVSRVADPAPNTIGIQIGDPALTFFNVSATVNSTMYFEVNSVPMQKYIQNVGNPSGVITNLLGKRLMQEGSAWPTFQPGENEFSVVTDQGIQDWELRYYERFGGL
jgi:Phage tail protein